MSWVRKWSIWLCLILSYQATASQVAPSLKKSNEGVKINAQAKVGLNGSANYTYPIPLPQGINGFTPKLSINYNSQAKQGLLGHGWNLSGLSVISRCQSSYFVDGEIQAVNLNQNDKFCLNGMRLVVVEGEYGKAEAEYRTLSDTYQKIHSRLTVNGYPTWFEVWDKHGNRSEYKTTFTGSGNIPVSWYLSKRVDKAGNEINYTYKQEESNSDSALYLDSISYSTFNVKLNYEKANHQITSYFANTRSERNLRLESLSIDTAGVGHNPSAVYSATPIYSDSTSVDFLERLEIGGYPNQGTIDAFSVQWEADDKPVLSGFQKKLGGNFSTTYSHFEGEFDVNFMSDVNGDGRSDFVGFAKDGVYVAFANEHGGFAAKSHRTKQFSEIHGGWNIHQHPRMMGDVNGDGRTDIVGFKNDGVYLALSTGTGFSSTSHKISEFGRNAGWEVGIHPRYLRDVNGDGRADIVGFKPTGVYVALSTGNGFSNAGHWNPHYGTQSGWNQNTQKQLADVNGDGRTDVVVFSDFGVYVSLSTGHSFAGKQHWSREYGLNLHLDNATYPRTLSDVNGDGRADIVGFKDNGVYVSLSTGNGFAASEKWTGFYGTNHKWETGKHPRRLADINGDGRSDIIGFASYGLYVSLSTGNGFSTRKRWVNQFGQDGGWNSGRTSRWILDGDGDGHADVIGAHHGGLYLSKGHQSPRKVVKITSNLGNETGFTYGNLLDSDLYNPDPDPVYPIKKVTRGTVVKSLTVSNGVGGTNEFSYKYEGKKRHLLGAGNLGFAAIHKLDKANNRVQSRYFHQEVENKLLYGALKREVQCVISDHSLFDSDYCSAASYEKVWEKNNTWSSITPKGTGFDGSGVSASMFDPEFELYERYNQQLQKQQIDKWDLFGTHLSTEATTYQRSPWFGHVLEEHSTLTDHVNNTDLTTKIEYRYLNKASSDWLINLMSQRKVTISGSHLYSVDGRTEYVTTSDYEYNSDGLLTTAYQERGTSLQTKTEYSDFDRGLPGMVTESWAASLNTNIKPYKQWVKNEKATLFYYDASGYVSSTTDALGQTTKTVYDAVFGNVTLSQHLDGTQTTYDYDGWGRLIGVNHPDGSWERTEFGLSDGVEHGRYSVTRLSSSEPRTKTTYDSLHRERMSEHQLLRASSYVKSTYNAQGQMVTQSEPSSTYGSILNRFTYDALGRKSTVTAPGKGTSRYDYQGSTVTYTNAKNQVTTTVFNALGQKIQLVDDARNTIDYYYDGWGNLTKTVDIEGNEIKVGFNALQQRVSLEDPDLGRITYQNNAFGQVAIQTDANNKESHYHYDLLGRQIKTVIDGTTANWLFNKKGQLTEINQPNYTEQYRYDNKGQLTAKDYFIEGAKYTQSYHYDTTGRLLLTDYGNQIQVRNSYNSKNVLNTLALSTNSGRSFKTVWTMTSQDHRGNVAKELLGNGISNEYNYSEATGFIDSTRSAGISLLNDGWNDVLEHTYKFDILGNLAQRREYVRLNIPLTSEVIQKAYLKAQYSTYLQDDFDYDNLNRLTAVTTKQDNAYDLVPRPHDVITDPGPGVVIDPGLVTGPNIDFGGRDFGNSNMLRSRSFHAQPAMFSSFAPSSLYADSPVFGSGASKPWIIDHDRPVSGGASKPWLKDYDGDKEYIKDISVVNIDYDRLGNITYKSDVGSYSYHGAQPHAVTRIVGQKSTSYRYDNSGNMLSGDGRAISYTSFNKPTRISSEKNITSFRYGPNQSRYQRLDVTPQGTTTTTYLDSVEVIESKGKKTFRYYIGGVAIYEKVVSGSAAATGLSYLHKDHIGSVIATTNEQGQITARFSFDAWGKRRAANWYAQENVTDSITGRLGFTGHEMLDTVGLIHMNGRVYDPTIGRFLSADPFIQDYFTGPQAFNRYSYVANNPLSYTDPTGYYLQAPEGSGQRDPSGNGSDPYGGLYDRGRSNNDRDSTAPPENQQELDNEAAYWGQEGYGNTTLRQASEFELTVGLAVADVAGGFTVGKGVVATKSLFGRLASYAKSLFNGKVTKSVDPGELKLPEERADGADPMKLHRQMKEYGNSTNDMPPIQVTKGKNGELMINDGATRATRIDTYNKIDGTNKKVPIEIIDNKPDWDFSDLPNVGG